MASDAERQALRADYSDRLHDVLPISSSPTESIGAGLGLRSGAWTATGLAGSINITSQTI